jgi:hypothetical protein
MMQQRNTIAEYHRAEARSRGSPHQDAISQSQLGILRDEYKDGDIIVLYKQQLLLRADEGDGGLERDWKVLAGLSVAQVMNGAQSGQRGRLGCPGSRCASEKNDNRSSQHLHLTTPVDPAR